MAAKWIWGLLLVAGGAGCMVKYHYQTSRSVRAGENGQIGDAQSGDAFGGDMGQANSPLLGKWMHKDGEVMNCYEFKGDGTCTRTLSVDKGSESVAGRWFVDDRGVLRISLSNGNLQGAEEPHEIRVDSRNLTFIEDGASGQFTRQ